MLRLFLFEPRKIEIKPCAQISQQVWRATEPNPALASVEFISAERTTESYQKSRPTKNGRRFVTLRLKNSSNNAFQIIGFGA